MEIQRNWNKSCRMLTPAGGQGRTTDATISARESSLQQNSRSVPQHDPQQLLQETSRHESRDLGRGFARGGHRVADIYSRVERKAEREVEGRFECSAPPIRDAAFVTPTRGELAEA